jgi:hypothetical protein
MNRISARMSTAQMVPTVMSLLFIVFMSKTQKAATKKVR